MCVCLATFSLLSSSSSSSSSPSPLLSSKIKQKTTVCNVSLRSEDFSTPCNERDHCCAAASCFSQKFVCIVLYVCLSVRVYLLFLFELSFSSDMIAMNAMSCERVRVCEWMFCDKRFKCKHNDKMKQFLFFGRFLLRLFHHSRIKSKYKWREHDLENWCEQHSHTHTHKNHTEKNKNRINGHMHADLSSVFYTHSNSSHKYDELTNNQRANLHERVRWMRKLAHHFCFAVAVVVDQRDTSTSQTDSNVSMVSFSFSF